MTQSPNGDQVSVPAEDDRTRIRREAAVHMWNVGILGAVGYERFEHSLFDGSDVGLEPIPEIPPTLLEEWRYQNQQVAMKNLEDEDGKHRSVSSNMRHDPWVLTLVEHRLPIREMCRLLKVECLGLLASCEVRPDPQRRGFTWELCHDGSFFRMMSPEDAQKRLPGKGFMGVHAEDLLCMLVQHRSLKIALCHRKTDVVSSEVVGHPDKVASLRIHGGNFAFVDRGIRMDSPNAIPAIRRLVPSPSSPSS